MFFLHFFQDWKLHQVNIQSPQSPLICVKQTRVYSSEELNIGDHVVFRRTLYDHHGIIVGKNGKRFNIIEPTKASIFEGKAKLECSETTFNFEKENVRVVIYTNRLRNEETAAQAKQIHEESKKDPEYYKYNLFTNNCEHFATFCATGRMYSLQVEDFESRSLSSYIKERLKSKVSGKDEQSRCFICIPSKNIESENDVKEGDIIEYVENNIWHHAVVITTLQSTKKTVRCRVAHCTSCDHTSGKKSKKEQDIVIPFKKLFYKLIFESSDLEMDKLEDVASKARKSSMPDFLTNACSQFPIWCKLKH